MSPAPTPDHDALLDAIRPVLDVVDPTRGACAAVLGEFVDLISAAPVGPDDLVTIVTDATRHGEVPIGPLAYAPGDPQFAVSDDGRSAWAYTEREPGVTNVIGTLHIEPGSVVVGGSRYGWIPDAGCVPSHVLLADLESVLAEQRVYLHRRAAQIGYLGRVRVTVHVHCEVPGRPLVLRRLDEVTGELLPGGEPVAHFTPIVTDYPLTASIEQTRRIYYGIAGRIAEQFGAPAPQFLADPDTDICDDVPVGPAA